MPSKDGSVLDTLGQWQQHLESLDPSRIELGLARVQQVFQRLDLKISSNVILVAGTNGKGSTVAALQALLLSTGASVGSYVSPHLQKFNERVCYQAEPVTDAELVQAFQRVEMVRGDTHLTYFEFTTLAAIALLHSKQPDYLIFEVGLGGRLDAVNILDADISVVTGIALDHTDWLGDNLEAIGYEKAGIYRANRPAIFASTDCPVSVSDRIAEIAATAYLAGREISLQSWAGETEYRVQFEHREHRISVARQQIAPVSMLAAIATFVLLGFELDDRRAALLAKVRLRGRYQRITHANTDFVLDVAHNPQAVSYLAQKVAADPLFKKTAAIVGVMSDKLLPELFAPMLDLVEHWFLVKPHTPRAATLQSQRQLLIDLGVDSRAISDIESMASIEQALMEIKAAVVYGSFYTVGEFLDHVSEQLGEHDFGEHD